MLVTDQFVFIHLPRTGGTFVSDIITKFFPSAREIGYHLPRELLPEKYAHLPVLGTVRSPWEFYVSWYHHHKTSHRYSPTKNVLFCAVSQDRRLNFVDTIRNALELGVNQSLLDSLIQALPDAFDYEHQHIPNLTKEVMGRIRSTGLGLFTFRFKEIFGKADEIFFCRNESLRDDLLAFFESIDVMTDALRESVTAESKKNSSDHTHYSSYYTPELSALVSIRDREIIERFGYAF